MAGNIDYLLKAAFLKVAFLKGRYSPRRHFSKVAFLRPRSSIPALKPGARDQHPTYGRLVTNRVTRSS